MRIAGVNIPDNKRLVIALTTIYGLGKSKAGEILDQAGIEHDRRAKDLNPEEENKIRTLVESGWIEGDLKREISSNIKRLRDIKSYRGWRHIKGLPSHGQRTKTNSRTKRGNVRRTMGSGRRKVEKK